MSFTAIPTDELIRAISALRCSSLPELSAQADSLEALIADQSAPYRDPRSGELSYSSDGDSWHNEDLGEFLRSNDELKAGSVVFRGVIHYQDPASFVDHHRLLTSMGENATSSDAGEWVDGWPNAGDQAEAELNALLEAWARKNCRPDFYLVVFSEAYTLTEDDLLHKTETGTPSPVLS